MVGTPRSATLWLVACQLALALAVVPASGAERPEYDPAFFTPTEQVVTPHIAWAKPYARGKVKALFITHRDAMREVIELAERMDLDYTVFVTESPTKFGETGIGIDMGWRLIKGNSAEELAERLRQDLQTRYDVIVIGNFKWDELPIDCRYLILKQVKEGTGLCGYIPTGRDEYISRILRRAVFPWRFYVWSGAAQGVPDFFGIGDFSGSRDAVNPHSGRYCVHIVGTRVVKGSREAPRGGYNCGTIPLEPNTDYVFSAWCRIKGDAAVPSISLNPAGGVAPAKSEQWQQVTTRFNSRAHKQCGVYLLNYGVGDVWYDDVSLKKAGSDENLLPDPGFEQGASADGPEGDLVRGVPFAGLPAFASLTNDNDFLLKNYEVTTFGKGRIALSTGYAVPLRQMMTPGPVGDLLTTPVLYYDYYLAAAAREILWAAGKDPTVTVEGTTPSVTIDRAAAQRPLPIRFNAAEPATGVTLDFTVRDLDNEILHHGTEKMSIVKGASERRLSLPPLPAGQYFADVTLRNGAGVVGWGSEPVTVTSALHIADLKLAAPAIKQTEPVRATVQLDSPTAGGSAVKFSVTDNFGRLVAVKRVAVNQGSTTVTASLPLPRPLTILQHLRADLIDKSGAVLDRKETPFSISNLYPPRDDVQFIIWTDLMADYISPLSAREFFRHHIDTQYTNFSPWDPRGNLWHLPYATRFVDTKTDWYQAKRTRTADDLIRDPCLTDPKYLASVRDTLTKVAEQTAPFSTSEFSLGDENHYVVGNYDLCFSPTCIADFRKFVRADYGDDLSKLNKEYGTAYKSWDEVMPETLAQAKQRGNLAPWFDHRRHMESVWAGIHAFSRDVIRQTVPGARVGYEGSDTEVNSYRAADFWKLAQAMDLNDIYYRRFISAAVRDFSTPGTLYGGGWYGGYLNCRNVPYMRWFPWMTLFGGANSFWVWMGYGTAGGVMATDLSLYPFFTANTQEIGEIKAGIGKLLLTSKRENDGVALLYSASSVHASTVTPELPSMEKTLNAWTGILDDLNVQHRVMSYAELAAGKLTNDQYKVIVLPFCQSLSPEEVAAVRKFAAAGGTVIADLRPAVMNQHGTPYPSGALDDLFGVRQNMKAVTAKSAAPALGDAALTKDGTLPACPSDSSLQVTDGHARGTVAAAPAVVTHTFGKGRGVLLNFSLSAYDDTDKASKDDFPGWAQGAPFRGLATALLNEAGVPARCTVTPALPRLRITRFQRAGIEYVGVLQDLPRPGEDYSRKLATLPPPQSVTLNFGRTANVVEVRSGKSFGHTATVKTEIQPGVAKLFALLPYTVTGVAVKSPAAVYAGQAYSYQVSVTAQGAHPADGVLRIKLRDPHGKDVECYASNLLYSKGKGTGELTFALNDAPGKWTFIARDVATGKTARHTVRVEQ